MLRPTQLPRGLTPPCKRPTRAPHPPAHGVFSHRPWELCKAGFDSFGLSSLLRINVFKVDVPREGGRGWKRTSAEVTSNELGEDLLKEVSKGADYVYRETWVPLVLLLSTTPA